MRAILILLLVGALLWLVLYGFRSVHAGASSAEPAGGLLLTSEATPAPAAPTAPAKESAKEPAKENVRPQATSTPAPAPTPSPAPAQAKPVAPPAPAVEPASAKPAQGNAAPADEVAVASVLLHRTQDLQSYLDGPGKALPAGRRDLALALQRLVVGSVDEARRMAEGLESRDGVRVSEATFLKQSLASGPKTMDAAQRGDSPLVLAAGLACIARDAKTALSAGKNREAALGYGELLQGEVLAPWSADRDSLVAWSDALAHAQAGYRWSPDGGWASSEVKVEAGDSLISVRKRVLKDHPEWLLCTGQIARANGLRSETIHPGQTLRVPTSRANVLVDLDAHWALYRLGNEVVAAWEIGVGKPGTETPPGEYVVGEKTKDPPWFRPGHPPVPFGDPENPLGTRWIAWQKADGTNTGLGFHGTKDPASIGEDQSQGCVRMRQPAIEELFEILPKGAKITVQP